MNETFGMIFNANVLGKMTATAGKPKVNPYNRKLFPQSYAAWNRGYSFGKRLVNTTVRNMRG